MAIFGVAGLIGVIAYLITREYLIREKNMSGREAFMISFIVGSITLFFIMFTLFTYFPDIYAWIWG